MTFIDFIQKPYGQLATFIAVTILMLILVRPRQAEPLWTMAGLFYIFFIVANAIFIWTSDHQWLYLLYSLGCSVAYILIMSGLTSVYSSIANVDGSGESGMIFLVIIYHPFILLFVMFLNWVYLKVF